MPRVTLWGFYQYDKTLFDGVVLPEGIDKENLIADIMRTSGDLYPYHQVPDMLKHNITFWFSRRLFDFERMYKALRMDYSPIENYDRIENVKRDYENSGTDKATTTLGSSTTSKHTGTDDETTTLGSSTTSKHTGTDTKETQVSAYNESSYTNRDKDSQNYDSTVTNTGSGSDTKKQIYDSTVTNTGSGSDTTQTDYGLKRKEVEEIRVHGNIGVTTSQQMIESELSLRMKYDMYRIITMEFEREFLVQIY